MTKIGLIGCGDWGRNHARTLARLGALAGVADADTARAAQIAADCACPAMTPEALLADPGIDGIVIALDPRSHSALGQRALQAGKHVLLEKPMALTAVEAQAIADTARAAGRVAMTGHILRFHPAFQALLSLARDGALGQLRHARATRFGYGKFFAGVDVIMDLAPHDLSLLLALAGGAPATARAVAAPVLTELADTARLTLDFAGGFSAQVDLSRVSDIKTRRLEVQASRATAVFDDLAPWPEKLTLTVEGGAPQPVAIAETPPLDAELTHFIDCIRAGRADIASADEGVAVLRVLDGLTPEVIAPQALPAELRPIERSLTP